MKGTCKMAQADTIKYNELLQTALTLEGSMGNTFNKFYNYSFANQVFFISQGLKEPVANYNVWKKLGRYAKAGTAKLVITPSLYKDKETGEEQFYGFRLKKAVFGYSDTTGEDLDLSAVVASGWELNRALEDLQIKLVDFAQTNGNIQGYSFERNIAINPVVAELLPTTFHELAHVVLGHTTKEKAEEYKTHRGIKEFQAEAVSYLLMKELEEPFNESESRAYIQNWLKQYTPTDKDISPIFTAVNKILKAGREQAEA